jgi:CheY-like chemotaxis protein
MGSSGEHKRVSERAAALEAERQRLALEQKKVADDAALSLLMGLDPDLEDSKVQHLKDMLTEEQIDKLRRGYEEVVRKSEAPVLPVTRPPITRPTPEALRDSRHESTPLPHPATMPSPPPKMTPPRGGIPIPESAYVSSGAPRPIIPPVTFPPRPGRREPEPPSSGYKILVIDDDASILDVLAETLRLEGFIVWRARDGVEGLKRLFQMPRCDLILLDIMLPRLNGADFLEVLDASQYSSTPVILISAAARPGRGLITDDRFVFVAKPIQLDLLLDTVRRRIAESKGYAVPLER